MRLFIRDKLGWFELILSKYLKRIMIREGVLMNSFINQAKDHPNFSFKKILFRVIV